MNVSKIESNSIPSEIPDENLNIRIFLTVCGVISLFCLLLTFLVYAIIPGFKNLHGKIVLNNIVSITLLTVYLLIVFNTEPSYSTYFCILIGYCGYFSSISMFSWMSIMCFDLFWTFSRSELPSSTSDKFKFRIYWTTGWGSAALLTTTLGLFQACLPEESEFNPAIGEGRCFIDHNGKSSLYLFYIPMLILMVFNSLTFLGIVFSFFLAKKSTKAARSSTR